MVVQAVPAAVHGGEGGLVHQALLVHAHGELALPLHGAEEVDEVVGVHAGDDLQIVGVDAGDAAGVQVGLPLVDEGAHEGGVHAGDHVHVQPHGVLPEDAVDEVHVAQGLRVQIPLAGDDLQHLAVAGGHVAAHPQHTHRDVG